MEKALRAEPVAAHAVARADDPEQQSLLLKSDARRQMPRFSPRLMVGLVVVAAVCGIASTHIGPQPGPPGAQFVRLVQRGAPWTTQKVLHVLILIAASVRVLFFYVASVAWDMGKGELSASEPVWRMAFYVCDELPTLLFFTVYTAVLLFWAELYLSLIHI